MKNFFFFSKSQRRGTLVLLVLIAVFIGCYYLLPLIVSTSETDDKTDLNKFKEEVQAFEKSLEQEKQPKWSYSNAPIYDNKTSVKTETYSLFSFDPNQADSSDFIRLGLSPRIAHNILKYRRKGGVFRSAEHFGKTYGISPEKFSELQPYIVLAEKTEQSSDSIIITSKIEKKDTVLELNTADTTNLRLIKGIGRGYAVSIVRYRQQLGGFYSIEQLREIPSMKEDNYLQIKNSFTVDSSLITPINVNKASVSVLEKHPYLTFTQAKEIYELRRMKFKLDTIEQLKALDHITAEDIIRLTPYLSFVK